MVTRLSVIAQVDMSTNVQSTPAVETTVVPIVLAVSMGHLLNDLMQSLIPASFPLFEEKFSLNFTQIGLISFVFQGIGSILQPLIGFYTDRRPMPYALSLGMLSTGIGLISLAHATSFAMILWS